MQIFLTRFLQDILYLARKASFLVHDLCKIYCKILQVVQENYLQDLHISCKTVFTGKFEVCLSVSVINTGQKMYARRGVIDAYLRILLLDFSPHAVAHFRHL